MALSKPKARYRQPQLDYWVKLVSDIWNDGACLAKAGEVYRVMQYLEEDGRFASMPTIRILSLRTQNLCGIYKHEFIFCNKQGEPDETTTRIAV